MSSSKSCIKYGMFTKWIFDMEKLEAESAVFFLPGFLAWILKKTFKVSPMVLGVGFGVDLCPHPIDFNKKIQHGIRVKK